MSSLAAEASRSSGSAPSRGFSEGRSAQRWHGRSVVNGAEHHVASGIEQGEGKQVAGAERHEAAHDQLIDARSGRHGRKTAGVGARPGAVRAHQRFDIVRAKDLRGGCTLADLRDERRGESLGQDRITGHADRKDSDARFPKRCAEEKARDRTQAGQHDERL